MESIIRLTKDFESQSITTITFRGKPAWLALEIGRVLGYSENGNRLTRKITQQWSDELVEGRDFIRLKGEELSDLKKVLEPGTDSVLSPFATHAVLLFESGVHFVCLKTEKPIGKRLRRFLVDEVMPQLVRDGAYLPERKVTKEGLLEFRDNQINIKLNRERRLSKQLEQKERQFKYKVLQSQIDTLRRSGHLGEDVIAAYQTSVVEELLDMDLDSLKPPMPEPYISPTEIAERLGTTAHAVGRIISQLGIRGDQRYSKAIMNKARGHERTVCSYLYKPCVVEMVRDELNRQTSQQLSLLSRTGKHGLWSLNKGE